MWTSLKFTPHRGCAAPLPALPFHFHGPIAAPQFPFLFFFFFWEEKEEGNGGRAGSSSGTGPNWCFGSHMEVHLKGTLLRLSKGSMRA